MRRHCAEKFSVQVLRKILDADIVNEAGEILDNALVLADYQIIIDSRARDMLRTQGYP
jgi:hypothetical protein